MFPGLALRRSPGALHPKGEKILAGFPPSPNPTNARALGPGGPDQRKARLMIAVRRYARLDVPSWLCVGPERQEKHVGLLQASHDPYER